MTPIVLDTGELSVLPNEYTWGGLLLCASISDENIVFGFLRIEMRYGLEEELKL